MGFLLILTMPAAAPDGAGAPARQPYVIQFSDDSVIVGFWDEKEVQSGGRARIELDAPWNRGAQRQMITLENVVSASPERPSVTAARIKKGWTDSGYILLDGTLPVPIDDYQRAQRARQIAGLDPPNADAADNVAPSVAEAALPVATKQPLPGFFEQWGAHIALLLIAVLLTGLIVRLTFLSDD